MFSLSLTRHFALDLQESVWMEFFNVQLTMYRGPRFSMKQVPFKKPGISQPDKRFPAFCGYRMFIIVPTK